MLSCDIVTGRYLDVNAIIAMGRYLDDTGSSILPSAGAANMPSGNALQAVGLAGRHAFGRKWQARRQAVRINLKNREGKALPQVLRGNPAAFRAG